MKTKLSSALLLLLTACIWGFAFVAQVVGGESVGTFWFNGIRFLIGAASLLPLIFLLERKKNTDSHSFRSGMVSGLILCAASNFQQWGINLTGSSGRAGFITALYTVLVPFFAAAFFRKRTGRNAVIGALLALIGLFLILSGGMASTDTPFFAVSLAFSLRGGIPSGGTLAVGLGDVVLFACAILFSFHILYIDSRGSSIQPIRFSCTQFFTAGIVSTFLALFTEPISHAAVSSALIPLLYGGIASTGIAYTLQIFGQRGAHPTVAAVLMSTESMFAAIGGALLLHERLSAEAYIGCAVIFAGIILSQIPSRRRKA